MSDTDWYNNKCGTRSLVVVPRTHKAPLKEPETARGVNWDVCRNDEGLAAKAVLVDPRPRREGLSGDPRAVELADRALQRALRSRKKRARSTGAYSPVVTQEGHFAADDAWLPILEEQGYAVVELSMDACSHERLLRLYREAVQLVNRGVVDASFPTRPRFETITAEHLPRTRRRAAAVLRLCEHALCERGAP